MKNLLVFILAIAGGMLGAYISDNYSTLSFGATTARTTITNPWTFSATTTTKNIDTGTTNAATSTIIAGCVQMTATSTATPVKFVIGSIATTSTSYDGVNTVGLVGWRYGKCPRI